MRTELPHRRRHLREDCRWGSHKWEVGVGFNDSGKVLEVFISGIKVGSEFEATTEDGAVLISLLLQHGVSLEDLAKRLGREGPDPGAPAASILGVTVHKALELERSWND